MRIRVERVAAADGGEYFVRRVAAWRDMVLFKKRRHVPASLPVSQSVGVRPTLLQAPSQMSGPVELEADASCLRISVAAKASTSAAFQRVELLREAQLPKNANVILKRAPSCFEGSIDQATGLALGIRPYLVGIGFAGRPGSTSDTTVPLTTAVPFVPLAASCEVVSFCDSAAKACESTVVVCCK